MIDLSLREFLDSAPGSVKIHLLISGTGGFCKAVAAKLICTPRKDLHVFDFRQVATTESFGGKPKQVCHHLGGNQERIQIRPIKNKKQARTLRDCSPQINFSGGL